MRQEDIIKHYGQPGEHQVYVDLPYPMVLAWDKSVVIKRFSCHEKVKAQIQDIFKDVLNFYGMEKIKEMGLDVFGGCLNIRPMRGGNKLSVHSWGLAVDLDPENNQLRMNHTEARFAKPEYNRFWEIVAKHGGYSLGMLKDYDWMHFQFVTVD